MAGSRGAFVSRRTATSAQEQKHRRGAVCMGLSRRVFFVILPADDGRVSQSDRPRVTGAMVVLLRKRSADP
jgi:hypothetical protein